jgi:hypothetical protein
MKHYIKIFLLSFVLILLIGPAASTAFMIDLTTPTGDSTMPVMTYATVTGQVDGTDSSLFHFNFSLAPDLSSSLTVGRNFGFDQIAFNTDLPLTEDMFVNFNPEIWNVNIPQNGNVAGFGFFSVGLTDPSNNTRLSSLSFDIDYTGSLSESDFLIDSTGQAGNGNGMFAMHIGGFEYTDALGDQRSVWVRDGDGDTPPVPEPATMILMGVSLLSVAAYMRRIIS